MRKLLVIVVLAFIAGAAATPESGVSGGSSARDAFCAQPDRLRLRRFEDRSAWLVCAGRILVRVHVPG